MKIGLYVKMVLAVIVICLFTFQQIFAEEIVVKKVAEIMENCISWQGKVIKFTFYSHGTIKQITIDTFKVRLYDEYREGIYAEFNEEGKGYVKKRKKYPRDREVGKPASGTVYAKVKNRNGQPYLRLMGRSKDKEVGGEVIYRW